MIKRIGIGIAFVICLAIGVQPTGTASGHEIVNADGTLGSRVPRAVDSRQDHGEPASPYASSATKAGARNQHTRVQSVVHAETDPNSTELAVYIVQLVDDPLTTYRGGLAGLGVTNPRSAGARKLAMGSAAVVAYQDYLGQTHALFRSAAENTLGREIEVLYEYDVVFNGVAMLLSPAEARSLLDVDGVKSIQRDQWRYPTTDTSPAFLGVTGIWDGSGAGGLPGAKGEGVIVGVIDSGVWPEHPSFADDGTYPAPPAYWDGECSTPSDGSLPYLCNNKLIGVQHFIDGYDAAVGGYHGLFYSGRDDNGHGTHTASTAAGNENVPAAIYGINRGLVSGMAPRAHVASYKGLGPLGGVNSDLVAAIDRAVADGVDVINYSIGSRNATDPWIDADAQAYLNAYAAGVFVATSAGNSGPNAATIGSPANAPWITSVGASYFNRLYLSEITLKTDDGASTANFYGATTTHGVDEFTLVDAEGIEDIDGAVEGKCLLPFAPGTFQATDVVLCERGEIATWAKGNFVNDGGAGAVILWNDTSSYDFNSYLHPIPGVVVLNEVGQQIKDFIAANPGKTIVASFTRGEAVFDPDPRVPTDTVVGFSSRGPTLNSTTNSYIDVIKPDVTAPGIHVLAGASPVYVSEASGFLDQFGQQGQLFQAVQGTSMSSPHVAGVGALMMALHPAWSPGEIRSALMSTARDADQMARHPAGDEPADPFDLGAGRIDMARAPSAGFVLDETSADFQAANPAAGGDPSALNLASINDANCVNRCSWTRTIESAIDVPVEWTVNVTAPSTMTLTVSPSVFTLAAGASQVISVTADVSAAEFGDWAFGQITFTPDAADTVDAHFPVAVRASVGDVPGDITIDTRRNQGTDTVSGIETIAIAELETAVYVGAPESAEAAIEQDPTNDDPYDLEAGGVNVTLVDVAATTKRFVVEVMASTAPDLDLFVGVDDNGDGLPSADEQRCASTSNSWNEICDFPLPDTELESGTYWVLIQNWLGSGAEEDAYIYAKTLIDESSTGPITATGPASVETNTPFDLVINWDIPDFAPGQSRYGVLEMRDAAAGVDIAEMSLTINRLDDDVVIESDAGPDGIFEPGDTVPYLITIKPELTLTGNSATYELVTTLPDGLSYMAGTSNLNTTAGSGSLEPTVNGQQLTWRVETPLERVYAMATNRDDPSCAVPFANDGAYVDLAGFNIPPLPVEGDGVVLSFENLYSGSGGAINYYGNDYSDLYFTDDGFGLMSMDPGADPGVNQEIPDPTAPNDVLATLWRDMEIVYDPENLRGVTVAGAFDGFLMLVEYDGMEPAPAGSTDDRVDFEVAMYRQPDDALGAYEIFFAYRNVNLSTPTGTIGLENADGAQAASYAYNDIDDIEGLAICFDWTNLAYLSFDTVIDPDTPESSFTTTVEHSVNDGPTGVAEDTLDVSRVVFDVAVNALDEIAAGENIAYSIVVSNTGVDKAENVVLTTQLPPGTTWVSGGSLEEDSVIWNLGDIPSGSSVTERLIVKPMGGEIGKPLAAAAGTAVDIPTIVGGIEAEPGAWPWQVAILDSAIEDGYLAQYCGGSLIDEEWVLTAGHCVEDADGNVVPTDWIDVAVGRHTLSSDAGQRIGVSQIVRHPDYDFFLLDGDVALLRLAESAALSGTIGSPGAVDLITLPTVEQNAILTPDTFAIVTGWGRRNAAEDAAINGPDYSDTLYQVTVPLVSNQVCGEVYDEFYGFEGNITDTMLCAGYYEGGKDACYGDSGGPLIVKDSSGSWIQAGMVSWGEDCALPQFYGVYARVPAFVDWIHGPGTNTYVNQLIVAVDSEGNSGSVAPETVATFVHPDTPTGIGPDDDPQAPFGESIYLPFVSGQE